MLDDPPRGDRRTFFGQAALLGAAAGTGLASGCWAPSQQQVVVYSALDQGFSQPILADFEESSGITVRANYDVESTKTVGLVNRILQESGRPRCDLFWNNEILHSLRLAKQGLLEAYHSPQAASYPANYRSPDGLWHGFAARARILIVNTELVAADERPTSILDLADPKWQGRVGIAKPLFGTTATHAAVLFATLGQDRAQAYFRSLQQNAQILSGNKQVALAVAGQQLAFGLTDTDDAIIEVDAGRPVSIVYPDQAEDQWGTLFIPNTLCLIKGSPNPANARKLVDHLLGPEIERRLASGQSAQFPVNPEVTITSRAMPETPVKWMDVDFEAAADAWEPAARFLRTHFT